MSTVAAPPSFAPVEAKMEAAGLSEAAIAAFKLNFDALASGATGLVRARERRGERDVRALPCFGHWRAAQGVAVVPDAAHARVWVWGMVLSSSTCREWGGFGTRRPGQDGATRRREVTGHSG